MGNCGGRNRPLPGEPALEGEGAAPASTPDTRSRGLSLRAKVILENSGKFTDFYKIDALLGKGAFGAVRVAEHVSTKEPRAVKCLSKANIRHVAAFKREIQVMKSMDHPNIIKLRESFEDSRQIWLVMELCEGGELFEHIIDLGHLNEKDVATLMKQMLYAIMYMHTSSVCHRDLKPENFLLSNNGPIATNTIKMIDFGLAKRFEVGDLMHTKAGTAFYVAPEVMSPAGYSEACDLWSCGVIMFTMLVGYPPFAGSTDKEVLRKVKAGKYSFKQEDWKEISEDAKNLVRGLLELSPVTRLTAEQAMQDRWIKDCAPNAGAVKLSDVFVQNLESFSSQNKLKKAALQIIAGQLRESELKELNETFKSLDTNSDGFITAEELNAGLQQANLETHHVEAIARGIDADGSGTIDYTEFLAAAMDKKLYSHRDVCWSAFIVFDQDGDGLISLEELKKILDSEEVGDILDGRCAEKILRDADSDGDGFIDFEEFLHMMQMDSGSETPGTPLRERWSGAQFPNKE